MNKLPVVFFIPVKINNANRVYKSTFIAGHFGTIPIFTNDNLDYIKLGIRWMIKDKPPNPKLAKH